MFHSVFTKIQYRGMNSQSRNKENFVEEAIFAMLIIMIPVSLIDCLTKISEQLYKYYYVFR